MIHIGIDPGLQGAVAALDETGDILWIRDVPICATGVDGPVLAMLLRGITSGADEPEPIRATVEHQIMVPRNGIKQTSGQFYAYGLVVGVLNGLGIEVRTVPVRTWQRTLTKGWPGGAKARSLAAATARWPAADLHGPRGGAKDGRADALNLAEYGRLTWSTLAPSP